MSHKPQLTGAPPLGCCTPASDPPPWPSPPPATLGIKDILPLLPPPSLPTDYAIYYGMISEITRPCVPAASATYCKSFQDPTFRKVNFPIRYKECLV